MLVELYQPGPLDSIGARGAQREEILGNQRLYVGGDILTAIDGQEITSFEDLYLILETQYQVDDSGNRHVASQRSGDYRDRYSGRRAINFFSN